MNDCIFCKIIKKEIPANIVYESNTLVVFPDTTPAADLHLLIVPKEHLEGLGEIGKDKGDLLTEVYDTVNKLVKEKELEQGPYRVVVNGGKAQHIPHLHFHLLGGQWKKKV